MVFSATVGSLGIIFGTMMVVVMVMLKMHTSYDSLVTQLEFKHVLTRDWAAEAQGLDPQH